MNQIVLSVVCNQSNRNTATLLNKEVEEIDEPVKVGNGNVIRAVKKGTIRLRAIQVDDTTRDIALQDYKHIPHLDVCLFSLTKALERGWSLRNQGLHIILTKNGVSIMFDRFDFCPRGSNRHSPSLVWPTLASILS